LIARGRHAEALVRCEERLAVDAADAFAAASAGALYLAAGDGTRAINYLRRALHLDARPGGVWGNLGTAYLLEGRFGRAVRMLARARRLGAAYPAEFTAACRGRAAELFGAGRRAAAARLLFRALSEGPDDALTWSNLGALYGSVGKVRAGIRCMRRAVLLCPENLGFRSNLAVISNYQADWTPERVRDWHLELFSDLGRPPGDYRNSPAPDRPLRVGYFSADFRFRPPAFFLPSLLGSHDHRHALRRCDVVARSE